MHKNLVFLDSEDHTEGDGEESAQGVVSRVQERVYGDTREGSENFAGMAQHLGLLQHQKLDGVLPTVGSKECLFLESKPLLYGILSSHLSGSLLWTELCASEVPMLIS